MIEYIQTIILIILLDRQLLLRNRYKFAIEFFKGYKSYNGNENDSAKGSFAIWIYCKKPQEEIYTRNLGKQLFYISWKSKHKR